MNFSRVCTSAAVAALAVTLSACGSDTGNEAPASPAASSVVDMNTTEAAPAPQASGCPTGAPAEGTAPEWTLPGTTGSVAVTGSTDTAAPLVSVQGPFSVAETQVHTLQAGAGPVVSDTATVLVCYMGVNGRDGTVFDSSYQRGAPVDFPLTGVVTGFQKAIAGQTVGSTVAVAMTPADGYPEGQPAAGIQPGDSLVFAIKILDATG
ncbi:peptidylprolyl isomerase [Mycobacterium sp. MS1601]|nr:FKBP-type peptidyl-prolyl cis-trans isomerase [Mycobacterium sp. MS1601]AQA06714.1 peptidylprolyl isomerase [Mycobacterium sp. MS1601]